MIRVMEGSCKGKMKSHYERKSNIQSLPEKEDSFMNHETPLT